MRLTRTGLAACVLLLAACDVRVQLGLRDGGADGGAGDLDGGALGACPALGPLPAWRQGLTVGSWVLLPNSALNRVTPSPIPAGSLELRLSGPAGMAADTATNTLYVAASGGNGDYAGNEVYRLQLNRGAPVWEIVTQPSDPSKVTMDASHGTDGRPSAAWGYYGTWFIEPLGQLLRFTAAGTWGTRGAVFPTIDGWSAQGEQWLPALTHPSFPGDVLAELPTAKDFSTGDVYQHLGDDHLYRWLASRDVIEDLGRPSVGFGSFYEVVASPLVFDPLRRRLIYFVDSTAPGSARIFDVATKRWSQQPLQGAASIGKTAMAFFDPCWKKIVVKTEEPNELLLVDPETLSVSRWPTSGQIPAIPLGGVHTLFQMLPGLGGYAFQPRTGSGVFFLPTR